MIAVLVLTVVAVLVPPLMPGLMPLLTMFRFFVAFLTALAMVVLAGLAVVLFAMTPRAALLATLLAAAACPGDYIDFSDRGCWIIAADHDFTGAWFLLRGFVANRHVEGRSRMQRRRERIVDQPPVAILPLEGNLGDVQVAVAHVAHLDGPERSPTALHSTKVGRTRHGKLS
jgi:hypothetical protein